MRILVSYFFGPTSIPLGESCARALEELGHEVGRFDSGASSPLYNLLLKPLGKFVRAISLKKLDPFKNFPHRFREAKLEKRVANFKPDILLVIRGHGYDPNFLQRLKIDYGIRKLIGWWVKGPKWFDLMKSEANAFDEYFCIHQEGYNAQDQIKHLAALGVDTVLYHPAKGALAVEHEVVFVGSWNPRRQAIIEQITDLPVEIYGPGWLKKNLFKPAIRNKVKASGIWGEDLVHLYRTSKIVLNISTWDPAKTTAFNLRLFDVPATGALLLTDASESLQQYLAPGSEVATFTNPQELREKISYFLGNSEARESIAQKGYKRVIGLGNYRDKMLTMLNATR